ncbi:potassium voltage-gated channel subfamily C member 4-like isoform X1 [Anguilla anguilla]|uniref:potassium voltage-gated channel subfamily C member 4-like isoform X1 n=1 Tax=Anguilla anguilla TaxID=7936 RepID=UPI0015B35B6F|nr:potassium voltage-gated channel subfamily C member 4-like isoform X1 [Anguilla anguilla]XP_035243411.1 potassium voltage-gated channel subfamily C member 4-like isoform X1 [Anguilla anguilla]XP_035243413.1 potassium voltage-gated channel subfamily C member 4-like isoform X1 [Anguilla anguilla]XP_035243414.1 potassium voltage-gated channel subfamily C member 4-like isoform X1 [Anguilla anguilla]
MAKREDSEKIVINVGGVRHETYKSCLKTWPGTRLARLAESLSDGDDAEPGSIGEFFYDRDPGMFTYILNYYRTGSLHCPPMVCGCLFEKELAFWGINDAGMEACCWVSYCSHRDRIETLRKLGPSDHEQQDGHNLLLLGPECREASRRSKIWALFDDPYSSKAAEVIAVISLIFILVSIINTCAGTHPFFHEFQVVHVAVTADYIMENDTVEPVPSKVFFVVEAVCVAWFTFEFLVRVVCCPVKLLFVSNPLNIVDFVAVLPFYLEVRPEFLPSSIRCILGMVRAVRFLRLLRVFRLMRDVVCVQVLRHTLRASLGYFFIISAFLGVASFMFGSLFFYAESLLDTVDMNVHDISGSAWWAVISMTTLGYGDIIPITWPGKVVGGLCAVTGVLTLALPVPALVNNFRIYHELVTAKRKLSTKRRYNPDLNVPVASTSGDLYHTQGSGCPLVTESIH